MKVTPAYGNDGTVLEINNSVNFLWKIWNDHANYWGHTNTLDFVHDDGHILMQLYPGKYVFINGWLNLDFYSKMHMTQTGTKAGANGFDFNPNKTTEGFLLEQFRSESSGLYLDGDYAVIYSPGDFNRLLRVYDEDGMSEKWYLDGSGYAHTLSDGSKKKNLKSIESPLSKLKSVKGLSFNYIKEDQTDKFKKEQKSGNGVLPGATYEPDENKFDNSQKTYYGFIAQQVEEIFPELVSTNDSGDKFISYIEFIPILVEALKEQEERIAALENNRIKLKSTADKPVISGMLMQNRPNPFNEQTTIEFYLRSEVVNATLYIYDLQGKQIKTIDIIQREYGSEIIYANELQPGMYKYALIADGTIIGTETMIITN